MASDTGLPSRVLNVVVRRTHSASRRRVTAQTKRVDARAREQPGIAGAVRCVTGRAALDFDGGMLKDERAALFAVTLEANRILRGCRTQLVLRGAAVNVVAIRALDEALIHAMMERLHELSLFGLVARIAQSGIFLSQQFFVDLGIVD